MMTTQTLLLTCSSTLIVLLHFFQASGAIPPHCSPSACGIIRNISYPFRLKDNPVDCGNPLYELACENNVTFVYLNSHKYYVKDINYRSSSIWLVDASINNHTCSFPNSSAYNYNFTRSFHSYYPYYRYYRYYPYYPDYPYGYYPYYPYDVACPINLMSCPYPLKNSSLFTDISHCASNSSSSSHPIFTYVKVGHMKASELKYMCWVEVIMTTSWKFKDFNNVSLSEIHHSLLYGFELTFYPMNEIPSSTTTWGERFKDFFYRLLPVFLVIVGLVCAVVSPPVMTIIGFAAVSLLLYHVVYQLVDISYNPAVPNNRWPYYLVVEPLIVEFIILALRVIIFPLALWLLIYKFRRRHWSIYNTIESFLQSDNKLTPIRYSYSNIKKITRGFQDKLGEGGYGTVYKGKLRSGHNVAVKLLRKSGANDQDFMNEIATIGRIHHVNVVKLVGYCAHGSKRALVFDFMPNGSLEKYIFNREKLNSLNWERKFDIAVGVARGIEYLHQGCDVQILHFDIKPHNILLDDKFIPKISDFGLAKFFSTDKKTVTMTAARGTIGYVAPELISRSIGAVSYKADVYSFGMLLMEMVSLKKDLIGNNGNSSQYFPHWIYDCFEQGKDIEIAKADNDDNDSTRKLARKMTIVALWCIQMSPNDRPSMNKVLEMLEGDVERLQLPQYPSQSTQILINEDETGITCSTDSVSLLHHNDALPYVEIIVQE